MSFDFKKLAEIKSINITKGGGDNSPVCVTVGLKFEVMDNVPIAAALGCYLPELDHFFNEDGEARFNGLTHIQTWADFVDEHEVQMLGFRCDVSKVSNILVRPYGDRRFELVCKIQLQNPPDHIIEKIAASLHGEKMVSLTHQSQLNFGEQQQDEAA